MADISKLKVGANTYDIKDPTARNTANNADSTKINGAKVIGTYTAGTETLEVSLEIGSVGE